MFYPRHAGFPQLPMIRLHADRLTGISKLPIVGICALHPVHGVEQHLPVG